MKNLNKSLLVVGIVALAGYGVSKNVIKETTELDALTLANVEALGQNESDGVQAVWNRNTFTCTIYGNGKIKIAGGSIVEVKGSLTFDGGLYCTTDGNATCSPVECNDLWQQIF